MINNNDAIHFPEGLIGFENMKDYKLFSSETEKDLHWLQPVNNEEIDFAVTFPDVFQVNYEINLSDTEERLLGFDENDELAVLVVLAKKPDENSSNSSLNANFMAPISLNRNKKLGYQKVLSKIENPVTITMRG